MTTTCQQCGVGVIGLRRGRRRRFCSDRCRLASHRQQSVTRRQRGTAPIVVPVVGGNLTAWAGWVRAQYDVDATGEQLLRLICEADRRYVQARDTLDRDGLVQKGADGRTSPRPEVAVERDTRTAIQKLIVQLGLENVDADPQTATGRSFPRRA